MTRPGYWLSAVAILPLMGFATGAVAQVSPPAAPATPENASAPGDAVSEIVVTAQKRSENLQKVPIVITAVSGAQLASAGVTSLPNIGTIAPGLNARTTAGGVFQPSIRGIGTSSNVVENPVALYIDGVYLPNQREGNRELPDVEQIAVLKGPQGTLFGRNATGGVIQITTRRPSQDFVLQGKAEIDNYATFRGSAFVSGGLTNGVAASLSADFTRQGDGFGTNRTTGNDTFKIAHALALRGKLLAEPGPNTSLLLIADYMDRKDFTYTFVPYPGTSFIAPLPGPTPRRQDTYAAFDPYAESKGGGISLTAEQNLDFAKLVSITAYRRASAGYLFEDVPVGRTTFDVGVANGDQPYHSFSQEFQLVSAGNGPLTYTFGVFYFYNSNANLPVLRQFFPVFYGNPPAAVLGGLNQTTQSYGEETARSIAPFGQAGIELFKDTKLTLGARFTYEKRELDGRVILNRYNGTSTTLLYTPAPLTIKKPTWRIALDHQFTPDVLGYVSYNRGIKSGGFNILTPSNPAYQPERLDAYEAGLKTELFDRHLRLNVGGFYYDYTNLQVTQFVGLSQSVVNGAKARLYGVDVDFNARATSELSFSGGLELLHARFTSYPNAVGSIPKATGGATLTVIDATGNRIPQSQRVAGTLAADYDHPVSFGALHFNVTANYNGNYKFEPDNFITQGAYTLVNASLTWRSADSKYSLQVWGRNLLDEIVLNNASSQAPGYPVSYGQPPRTFGVTGRINL